MHQTIAITEKKNNGMSALRPLTYHFTLLYFNSLAIQKTTSIKRLRVSQQ